VTFSFVPSNSLGACVH